MHYINSIDNEKYSTKLDVFSSSDLPLKVNSVKRQFIFKQKQQDILSIDNEVKGRYIIFS